MDVVYREIEQPLGRVVAVKAVKPSLIEDEGIPLFELRAKMRVGAGAGALEAATLGAMRPRD